jgi:hypothetical protein
MEYTAWAFYDYGIFFRNDSYIGVLRREVLPEINNRISLMALYGATSDCKDILINFIEEVYKGEE